MVDREGEGSVRLTFARISDLLPRRAELEALLSDDERARAARFRFEQDRERYIAGHAMMREILARHLDAEPTELRFARAEFGKPYVLGSRLRFNFSDTKDAVLLATADEQEIGIDLETMTRTVDHRAVSEHYFTPAETEDIGRARDEKRRFLELWTRKEAVLKASGVGIMEDLRVMRVDAAKNTMMIAHEEFLRLAAPEYHVRTWHLGEDHIISLATDSAISGIAFSRFAR